MPEYFVRKSGSAVSYQPVEAKVVVKTISEKVFVTKTQQGPPGPPGPGGVTTHSLPAGEILGGHRVVVRGASGVAIASADNADHVARVIGITLGSATAGSPVTVQAAGAITELSWTWVPDEDIYLGLNGVLTQTIPPTAAFAQRVGYAVNPTSMWVVLGEPIELQGA